MAWYENRNLVEFLSDIGRHFRMGHMLAKHRYMHSFLYLTNLGFVLTEVFADVKFFVNIIMKIMFMRGVKTL